MSGVVVDLARQGMTGDDVLLHAEMTVIDDGIAAMNLVGIVILEEQVLRALTVRLRFSAAQGSHAA